MKTIKKMLREMVNWLTPSESITASKEKWNTLAEKNAAYYVMTDYGENITEEQFRESGKKDYADLIEADSFLKQNLSPYNTKAVLEIGCGIGRISEFLAEHFKSVVGVDISEEMVRKAGIRLAKNTNASFKATDGTSFPFSDNTFDFVFSFIVFQHMPDKKTVMRNLSEVARVLKPGAIAKIQLRGLPTSKRRWFYGPSFLKNDVTRMITDLPLSLEKSEGEGQRYFWVWLRKKS